MRWTFARDLLLDGLYEPTGDGDVHVWPCLDSDGHAVVIIELCSPDGEALVQMRTGELSAFNERVTKAVPAGEESELPGPRRHHQRDLRSRGCLILSLSGNSPD